MKLLKIFIRSPWVIALAFFVFALCHLDKDGLVPYGAGLAGGRIAAKAIKLAQEITADGSPIAESYRRFVSRIRSGIEAGFGNAKGMGDVSYWSPKAKKWMTIVTPNNIVPEKERNRE